MQDEKDQAQFPQYPQAQYPQTQYPQPRGVEFLEVENKEEDLVAEKENLYAIIVGTLDTFPGIEQILLRPVLIVNMFTILSKSSFS